jgi:hypothetical protein
MHFRDLDTCCSRGVQVEYEGQATSGKPGHNERRSRPILEYFINLLECKNKNFYLNAVEWETGISMRVNNTLRAKEAWVLAVEAA